MRFAVTPEQEALRDSVRELLERESPPSRVRAAWDGAPRDPKVWRRIAELGVCGLLVPAGYDGADATPLDLLVVLEEAGRSALPEPLLETAAVAAPVLSTFGDDAQRARWLPAIASGEAVASTSIASAPLALDADVADVLLWQSGTELHVLAAGSFHAERVRSVDRARRLFRIEATPSDETRLAPGAAEQAAELGAVAAAAVLNGVGMRLIEMTTDHAKARHQFGKPIGSFQAVKHMLATASVALDAARGAAWYAAYVQGHDADDRARAAAVAKAAAGEAAATSNTVALQVHAGIGFTWEHDLHLWLKRGKALEAAYGSAREHRARLAAALFDGGPDA